MAQSAAVTAGQCVTFQVGEEVYGIDIAYVQEIIRVPGMVRVPRTPPYFAGLANLRGDILAVVDTRMKFGLEKRSLGETSRVIVLDDGVRRLGFIVDRVLEVVNLSAEEIEEVRETGTRAEFLRGVARLGGGARLVLLVEAARLMQGEERAAAASGEAVARVSRRQDSRKEEKEEEVQLVSFRLGGEEYGLDIGVVQEIVHLPESINGLPNAPAYVEGVMVLRSRVLPVVSLRALFGLGDGELDERARVVVVNLGAKNAAQPAATVGLVVDAVAEVLRVPRNVISPVPALLRTVAEEGISGVCKLKEGRRLVYVLEAEKLLAAGELLELVGGQQAGQETGQKAAAAKEEEEQLVTFRLGQEEFAAAITEVREIIRVPEIVAVPRAPHFVEGVINLRGTVIPVIDLRKRFGLEAKNRDEHTRIVVVEIDGVLTGVVVDAVREVIKVARTNIERAPALLATHVDTRFLRGIAKVAGGERLIIVLDVREVLSLAEREELAEFEKHVEGKEDTGAGS